MVTQTQLLILTVFVATITKKYTIKQISNALNKHYPLIHRSIKPLIKQNILHEDEHKLLSLNYKKNHALLTYVESLREPPQETIKLTQELLQKKPDDYIIILLFGSAVHKKNPQDYDVLIICHNPELYEKMANVLAQKYQKTFDIHVTTPASVKEMLLQREQKNVMNELLNKHKILAGAEQFYKLITHARR